jgi:hypothetical protein
MAAPSRQRFPLSVSSARAILRCRGIVAAIIGHCLTAGPVAVGLLRRRRDPESALGVMGEQDLGFPDPAGRKLTGSAASCAPKPSWCPRRALPRSRSGPTSPPLPSCASWNRSPAVPRARLIQPSMSAETGADRWLTHRAAEPDVNVAGSAAPAAARTSGGQDTHSGPWNARASLIPEVGNPTGPFIPLRDAIAMPSRLANVRVLTVHGYGHTAFLRRAPAPGTTCRLLPHWCPRAEGPRARGLKSVGCEAQ